MKKSKISLVVLVALALGLGTSVAFAKNDNAKSQSQDKGKSKTAQLKDYQKPDKSKGETNAQIHKVKSENVVKNLEKVAVQEESAGNTEVSEDIEQVVAQQQMQTGTTDAIEQVESRNKLKTLLVGADYKNLGQLRSSLVQNRNQIRQLTRSMSQIHTDADRVLLEQQLTTLMQERERIKTVIATNESSFSILGWVTRFLTNYEQTPINEGEENALTEEVEEAIEDAAETTPAVTETTDAADTTAPTSPAAAATTTATADTTAPATSTVAQ